jgi:hypothetical protein
MQSFISILVVACLIALHPAQAFVLKTSRIGRSFPLRNDSSGGGIEEIEFRIYPDGRVTEIVRGVRGKNCQDITEAINKQLGNVVASQPTEEMFEEEVFIQTTLEQKVDGGWEGGGGTSSW